MSELSNKPARTIALLLPNLAGGGAERVSVNLANGFLERGYHVDMVLMSATGELLDDLRPGIRVVDLKMKRLRWALPALIRYLCQSKPAAMLACMWPLTVMALWAKIFTGVPTRIIVAEHTTWSRSELLARKSVERLIRATMRTAFPRAASVVTVSQGAADDLAQFANLDRSQIKVIYNPVVGDCAGVASTPLAPVGWWTGSHKRVLAVGTLKSIKDYATLLDAFALLCRDMDARLLILGEGACRAALESQVERLGLVGKVFMPGFVKETLPYYQQADLHVLSSMGEGLPTVIIEALAAGTPVVSTDCPSGPREILCGEQFGRLVPVGDSSGLSAAMADSLKNPQDCDMLKVRAQDFSISKAVDQYLDLLFLGRGV